MSKGRNIEKKRIAREQRVLARKTKQRKQFIAVLIIVLSVCALGGLIYGGIYLYNHDYSIPRNQFETQVNSDGTLTILSLNQGYSPTGTMKIPSEIDGRKVTKIGSSAFQDTKGITEVHIPATVTVIDNLAFSRCTSLKRVKIDGNSLSKIGDKAFYQCTALESITIPEGLESIGTEAFGQCKALSSFKSPSTLRTIGQYAFLNCTGLNKEGALVLSESITSIGEFAFSSIKKDYIDAPEGSYAARYVSNMSN